MIQFTFANLYKSMLEAYKTETSNEGVQFRVNWVSNLLTLQSRLNSNNWTPNPYRYFTIYKPKERSISQAHFEDRVVHHAYIDIIKNYYLLIFSPNSYASLPNKGVHRARGKAYELRNKYQYFLKTDIKHYFESINHQTLKKILINHINDSTLNYLENVIIDNTISKEKGLPIGNLTSQFWANIYLNELDNFITSNHLEFVRYMDDTIIFSNNKKTLKNFLPRLRNFLLLTLKLELKEHVTLLSNQYLPFCGTLFNINDHHLRRENKVRYNKDFKSRLQNYILGSTEEFRFSSQLSTNNSIFNRLIVV